jgi:hypothetical protein
MSSSAPRAEVNVSEERELFIEDNEHRYSTYGIA